MFFDRVNGSFLKIMIQVLHSALFYDLLERSILVRFLVKEKRQQVDLLYLDIYTGMLIRFLV